MVSALHTLTASIDNGLQYLRSEQLAASYVQQSILEPLAAGITSLLPTIDARHVLPTTGEQSTTRCVHYTSLKTLLSWFPNDPDASPTPTLRLYDSVHLNDPDEGYYLVKVVREHAGYAWLELGERDPETAYLASFILPTSKNHATDNLVFWRMYGEGGQGLSVAFFVPTIRLRRVLYGHEQAQDTINTLTPIFDSVSDILSAVPPALHDATRASLVNCVLSSLKSILYLYKSHAYEYENECRCVVLASDLHSNSGSQAQFEYRQNSAGRHQLRHYSTLKDFSISQLLQSGSTVTIGPCVPHHNNIKHYLETMKKRRDTTVPEIEHSKIAYRQP